METAELYKKMPSRNHISQASCCYKALTFIRFLCFGIGVLTKYQEGKLLF